MPRIGSMPEQQSSGGNFSFAEGRGVIVNSVITNHAIPNYGTDCGYIISIQRLTPDGKPTNDEPVDEFIKAGPVEVFHPGMASGPDDRDPQLEINGSKDCGVLEGAVGNCLLTTGRGPDKQSKLTIFTNAAIEQGMKKELFDGWAANLIGLDAHFTQFMMQRPKNSTAKNDPTCLIIGRAGKPSPDRLVYKYPDGTGVAQLTPAATGSSGRSTPPPSATSQAQPINGAPAIPATAATSVIASVIPISQPTAQAPAQSLADGAEPDEQIALRILADMKPGLVGKAINRKKLAAKMTVALATARIQAARHAAIAGLVRSNDDWFMETAEAFGWAVEGTGEAAVVTVTA